MRPLVLACQVAQSWLAMCNPMDCSPPDSSVHGVLRARILEWVEAFWASVPPSGLWSREHWLPCSRVWEQCPAQACNWQPRLLHAGPCPSIQKTFHVLLPFPHSQLKTMIVLVLECQVLGPFRSTMYVCLVSPPVWAEHRGMDCEWASLPNSIWHPGTVFSLVRFLGFQPQKQDSLCW